jgi:hypothetical protein
MEEVTVMAPLSKTQDCSSFYLKYELPALELESGELPPDLAWVYHHPKMSGLGRVKDYPEPPTRGASGLLKSACEDEKSKASFYTKVLQSQQKHHIERMKDAVGERRVASEKHVVALEKVLGGLLEEWKAR